MLDVVDGRPWLALRYLVFRYWRGRVIGTLLERPCARRYWMVRMAWRHHPSTNAWAWANARTNARLRAEDRVDVKTNVSAMG